MQWYTDLSAGHICFSNTLRSFVSLTAEGAIPFYAEDFTALRTNFDKPDIMKELFKRLQNVDSVLQRTTIIGEHCAIVTVLIIVYI